MLILTTFYAENSPKVHRQQQKVSLTELFNFIYVPVVSEREWAVKSKFDACQQCATLPKLQVYFESQKTLGRPQPPQTISARGKAIVAEKLYAGSIGPTSRKCLAIEQNTHVYALMVCHFSPTCNVRTPWVMPSSRRNLTFSPPNCLGVGRKIFESRF